MLRFLFTAFALTGLALAAGLYLFFEQPAPPPREQPTRTAANPLPTPTPTAAAPAAVDLLPEPEPSPSPIPTEAGRPAPPAPAASPSVPPRGSTVLEKLQTETSAPPALNAVGEPRPTATALPEPSRGPSTTVELRGSGFASLVYQDDTLEFVKIGFHVGPGGDTNGLGDWMAALDAAGIPFFLKSVDYAGPLLEAQALAQKSGVPHVLVYRRSGGPFELPNYDLNPVQAAREHWERHRDAFPPELDPSLVWLETINEVDKERAGWLGLFALETGRLALADGYRWAAFGWSAGEPEMADWTEPGMVAFLRLAAANPDRLAVALHEYSYLSGDLLREYPHFVGRFQQLFWVCDELGIDRPTVLITEFGWEYRDLPEPAEALRQLRQAALIYASFPEVKGAAIWYLGPGFGTIDSQTRRLLAPLADYAQSHYFSRPARQEINPVIFQ